VPKKKKNRANYDNHHPTPSDLAGRDIISKTRDDLDRRLKKKGNDATTELLTQWAGTSVEEATWEDIHELRWRFPNLVGKVF
jgi:hypothetical protein